jgi:hypothetical protein
MNPYVHHSSFIDERWFVGKTIFDLLHQFLCNNPSSMKELRLFILLILGQGIRCFYLIILPKNVHWKSSK